MRRQFASSAPLLLFVLIFSQACGSRERSHESLGPTDMPSFFPAGGLLLPGDPELVLAEGKHGILLTLAEYNGRIYDENLPAELDTTSARRRYLRMLLDYKVAAVEAKLRGFVAKTAEHSVAQERELAQQILQQSIMAAAGIPDDQAIAYVKAHPEQFASEREIDLSDRGTLQHVKYKLQDQRLRAQLDGWLAREEVAIHWDRVPGLSPDTQAAEDPMPSQRESEEPQS